MNGWFIRYYMAYSSFTVHLPKAEMNKLEQMKAKNPDFSRNALIKLAIMEWNPNEVSEMNNLKRKFNSLHKKLDPSWKRKKSLPFFFEDEYRVDANYSDFHGGGDE